MAAASPTPAAVETERANLEAFCLAVAQRALGARAAWDSMRADIARAGVPLTTVFDAQTLKTHADADAHLQVYARAIVALQSGDAQLVRWKRQNAPDIYWGVHKVNTALGFWPLVAAVIVVVGAFTGVWFLTDTWGAARKIDAEAKLRNAQTLAALQKQSQLMRGQGRTDVADQVDLMISRALAQNDNPPPGLLERLAKGLSDVGAGAGVGIGAIGILAIAWALSNRGSSSSSSRPSRRWRSPVTFRKPVQFRSPTY